MDKSYIVVEHNDGDVNVKSTVFNNLKEATEHYTKVSPKNSVEQVIHNHRHAGEDLRVSKLDKVTVTLYAL